MTPPPWIFLSSLYTLKGQVSAKSCHRAVDFGFLNSYNRGLMKVKESMLPVMLLTLMLMNLNPLIKLFFICTTRRRPIFLLFC